MNILSIILSLLPILLVLILLIWRRMAADIAGLIGWVVTILVAILGFQTAPSVALLSSLAGVVASFPITLMVAASLLQVFIMIDSGALARVVTLIKTISPAISCADHDRQTSALAPCWQLWVPLRFLFSPQSW